MKIASQLITLLFLYSIANAHSVRVNIYNKSTTSVRPEFTSGNYKGFFCNTFKYTFTNGNTSIEPGTAQYYTTGESAGFCGVRGFLDLSGYDENGKRLFIHIDYDNPFVGGNEFHYKADHPFAIKYLGGGEGSDMEISFEIGGGPQPAPPPPPINLPTTGSKIIKGQFYWDSDEIGEPQSDNAKMRLINYLTTAFKVEVSAPAQLIRSKDGTGNKNFGGYTGYYGNVQKLANARIVFTDSRNEQHENSLMASNVLSPIRVIKFTVSNLPDNLPLHVSVNTVNANWNTGSKTPPKLSGRPDEKWMVFIHEKDNTGSVIKFQVYGAWFTDNEGYSSDNITPINKEIFASIKRKVMQIDFNGKPGDIFEMGNI